MSRWFRIAGTGCVLAGMRIAVLNVACLQCLVDRRPCEGRVGADHDPMPRGLLAFDLRFAGDSGGSNSASSWSSASRPPTLCPVAGLGVVAHDRPRR